MNRADYNRPLWYGEIVDGRMATLQGETAREIANKSGWLVVDEDEFGGLLLQPVHEEYDSEIESQIMDGEEFMHRLGTFRGSDYYVYIPTME